MSRRKKAIAQGWAAIDKQRDEENNVSQQKAKSEEISEEEHQKKVNMLKEIGLIE